MAAQTKAEITQSAFNSINDAIQNSASTTGAAIGQVSTLAQNIASQNIQYLQQTSSQAMGLLAPYIAAYTTNGSNGLSQAISQGPQATATQYASNPLVQQYSSSNQAAQPYGALPPSSQALNQPQQGPQAPVAPTAPQSYASQQQAGLAAAQQQLQSAQGIYDKAMSAASQPNTQGLAGTSINNLGLTNGMQAASNILSQFSQYSGNFNNGNGLSSTPGTPAQTLKDLQTAQQVMANNPNAFAHSNLSQDINSAISTINQGMQGQAQGAASQGQASTAAQQAWNTAQQQYGQVQAAWGSTGANADANAAQQQQYQQAQQQYQQQLAAYNQSMQPQTTSLQGAAAAPTPSNQVTGGGGQSGGGGASGSWSSSSSPSNGNGSTTGGNGATSQGNLSMQQNAPNQQALIPFSQIQSQMDQAAQGAITVGTNAAMNSASANGLTNSINTLGAIQQLGQNTIGSMEFPYLSQALQGQNQNITANNQIQAQYGSNLNSALAGMSNTQTGANASMYGANAGLQANTNTTNAQLFNTQSNTALGGAQVLGQGGAAVTGQNSTMGTTQGNAIMAGAQNQSNALMSSAYLQLAAAQQGFGM